MYTFDLCLQIINISEMSNFISFTVYKMHYLVYTVICMHKHQWSAPNNELSTYYFVMVTDCSLACVINHICLAILELFLCKVQAAGRRDTSGIYN